MNQLQSTLHFESVERWNIIADIDTIRKSLAKDDFMKDIDLIVWSLKDINGRIKDIKRLEEKQKLEESKPLPSNLTVIPFEVETN